MNKFCVLFLACLTFLMAAACSSQKVETHLDQDAVIPLQNEKNTQLIRNALTLLLNGAQVQIADNAFTENSLLVIHRSQLTGRDIGTIHRFRLVKNADNCILVYENNASREVIPELSCAAKTQQP